MKARLTAALAVAALAAGAAAILLGLAVLGERDSLTRAQVSLAVPVPEGSIARSGGVAGSVLGTGGDRTALAASADYQQARAETALAPAVRDRSRAEAELSPLAATGSPAQRSWASTLLGVLEFDAARLDRGAARRHLQASTAALESAVAADPANDDAKRDLELVLTLQQGKSKTKHRQHQQSRPPHGRPRGKPQASAAPVGSGW